MAYNSSIATAPTYSSSAGSSTLPAIEKLVGRENFNTWKFAIKTYLEHEELWDCVEPSDVETIDPRRDRKAKAKIVLSIDPVNYVHVQSANTAKEVWNNLNRAFEDTGLTRKVGLLKILITTRLENCESIDEYVNKIITTAHRLRSINFYISDEWVGTLLLAGLPEEYAPMIMGIESSGIEITADSIKVKLLQDVKNTKGSALITKGTIKKGPRCYECNRFGHFAKNCFKRNKQPNNIKKSTSKALLTTLVMSTGVSKSDEWYIDSGASVHVTNSTKGLNNKKICENKEIAIANNSKISINHIGNVELKIINDGVMDNVTVRNVMHAPDISVNLLSVSKITELGHTVIFDACKCKVYDNQKNLIASATQVNGMYKLDRSFDSMYIVSQEDVGLWHNRLGHPGKETLIKIKDVVNGINLPDHIDIEACISCAKGKQSRYPFKSSNCKKTVQPLELIHSDVCGPLEEKSIGESKYFVTFIDDYTRKVFVYFIKQKSEVTEVFKNFKNYVENQTGRKIKTLRTDNGREYINEGLTKILRDAGIKHETTAPYTPQQNGVAERMNRTLCEKSRCMMSTANLNKRFWAEAVNTAAHVVNCLPTKKLKNMTPEEAWSGKKPNLSYLKVFGCRALAHIPKEKRLKLDMKSTESIFVGYCDNSKAYRLYDLNSRKIFISRDVIFLEDQFMKSEDNQFERKTFIPSTEKPSENRSNEEVDNIEETNETIQAEEFAANENSDETNYSEEHFEEDTGNTSVRRSERIPKPKEFPDYYTYMVNTENEPETLDEVLNSAEKEEWLTAITEEYKSLCENKTWELKELPEGKKPLDVKWVFRKKTNYEGKVERYKARLVVKGYAQRKGVDYDETFSPVMRHGSLRLVLALAVKYNLDMDHMDAVTAFLQGELEEEVYIKLPKPFETQEHMVGKLKKAMYGLKQSGRAWNKKLDQTLKKLGLKQSKKDQCIYYEKKGKEIVIIAVYVDDILIFSNNNKRKIEIKRKLEEQFKMKDLGELKNCLGIRITRNREEKKLWLDQTKYIQEVLEKFNMLECNPVSTPLDVSQKLTKDMAPKTKQEEEEVKLIPYRQAIGSLMYICQSTRPDISFAIGLLSRFNNCFGKAHWSAVKRVFRYLKGTEDWKLEYSNNENEDLIGYSDADWANDCDDRRSITGYGYLFQNGLISWNSRKQPTVALSSTEAEYMALSAATQESIYLRDLLNEISPNFKNKAVIIRCDNKGAIDLANTGNHKPRTKHIDVRHHFIKEKLEEKIIRLEQVGTKKMLADVFTKSLPSPTLKTLISEMGIRNFSSSTGGVGE